METLSRRHFFTLAGGLAAAALIGCGDDENESTPAAQGTAASAGTAATSKFSGVKPAAQISYWSVHPANSKAVEEELIKRFHAQHPEIKVNLVTAGANYAEVSEKFNAGLVAKQVPDVVMLSDVWWFKYYLAKTITPLDDLIKEVKIDLPDYQDTLVNDYKYQGKQWAMPFARSTPLFYYNKDKWAAAGLPDRGPKTWDEMNEWGEKLQAKAGPNQFAFTHVKGDSYVAWTFQGVIWQYGGRYSDEKFNIMLDKQEAIDAGNFVRSQVHGPKKYANVTANSETADFIAGQTASILSSTGGLAGVLRDAKFPVGTSFYPEKKQFGCPTGGAGLAIPDAIPDANKVAAMTFLKFLGEPDNTAYYSQNVGYMPVRKSAITGPMANFLKEKPQFKTAIDQLAKTQPQDAARVYIPGGDAILGKGLERMLLNNEDAKNVWPEVSAQLKKAYEQDVKPKLPA